MGTRVDIEENLNQYLSERSGPAPRDKSFDYCYNYFQGFRERKALKTLTSRSNVQESCLQLGFFLASWGMFRGSGVLYRRSAKYYIGPLDAIARTGEEVWRIDANDYSPENRGLIRESADHLRSSFPEGATDTLVTKVMLGVLGCVPAFDTDFMKGLGVSKLSEAALCKISRFYDENQRTIERRRTKTIDFELDSKTKRSIPRAKVIDMILVTEGQR